MRSFRQGKIWVLICTELLSRGIDFKGVNLVINYDFPKSGISYVHRIGRSGRAGKLGRAVTFFTDNDLPDLRRIVNIIKDSGCRVPDFMLNLKKNKKPKKFNSNKNNKTKNKAVKKNGTLKKKKDKIDNKKVKKIKKSKLTT